MLRKSKHKCYEILNAMKSLEGLMKKEKEWKEYTNGKVKEIERLEKKKERNICYLKYCAYSICYRLL